MLSSCPIQRAKPGTNFPVSRQTVEHARRELVEGDDSTGDELFQCSLDRHLIATHPPSRNSPGRVHGVLVVKQETHNLFAKGMRFEGVRDDHCLLATRGTFRNGCIPVEGGCESCATPRILRALSLPDDE